MALPDGSLLQVLHSATVTIKIDRQYKADLTFKILPLKGVGVILGNPWLILVGAQIDCLEKTVRFEHRNRSVLLLPHNLVFQVPPIEPIVVSPQDWVTSTSMGVSHT